MAKSRGTIKRTETEKGKRTAQNYRSIYSIYNAKMDSGKSKDKSKSVKLTDSSTNKNDAEKSSTKKMTVLDKIVHAIRALDNRSSKGSSRQAITKYLKSELDFNNPSLLKKNLTKGVKDNILVQNGQSFRVQGDPFCDDEPEEEKVQIINVQLGTGELVATDQDVVTVRYVGTLEDGEEFDKGKRFTFLLGAGEVVKGMDIGVRGMRENGMRKIVIPSKLGYGKRGSPPEIPKNARLYFEITLVKLERL